MKATDFRNIYNEKCILLQDAISNSETNTIKPPIPDVGFCVFLSMSDGKTQAHVVHATGSSIPVAFKSARYAMRDYLDRTNMEPLWLKADVVIEHKRGTAEDLAPVWDQYHEFFRYGISFDRYYNTALIEPEVNVSKVLDYKNRRVSLDALNRYMTLQDRGQVQTFPHHLYFFRCASWLCDEDKQVLQLFSKGLVTGRRKIDLIDKPFINELLLNAMSYLTRQLRPDGSFIYGIYPSFNKEIDNYNYVRHASTLWSLICDWRITHDDSLIPLIDHSFQYVMDNAMVYRDDNTAYLIEPKHSEIKLGGPAICVIGMTEYMDAFSSDKYMKEVLAFGNGILSMFDQETGSFTHVLNTDYSVKEAFRTVYFEGEATFAFCRLYRLTKDEKWLNAAKASVDRMIREKYYTHHDHWVAYAMNEITKYVPSVEYYTFALQNAHRNLHFFYYRETTYHTFLELLMVTFETYERILEDGVDVPYLKTFNKENFLRTLYCRLDRMMNGYFFPEYAMYMRKPDRILNTFMVRHDGYRIRIDDVQHNIGGMYLFYKDFDRLVEAGLLDAIKDGYGDDLDYGVQLMDT